ncbi:hypothetical protein EDD29_0351 [Actinocorallia herbida]|uniref:Uncharacterized protein n=2 Tax=Actinocorallia herbida TaxID=58109 RepID=A0A3N1CNG7_9ACTN|nr:hypothetical protein EDD29_0351 [Actinocorallia herbida]
MNGDEGGAKVALYGLLGIGGALVALIGAFEYTAFRPAPVVSCLFVLLGTFLAILGAGWAAGTRYGALVAAVPWVLVTGALSVGPKEGDIVISGDILGVVYLLGGMVVALIAIALSPEPHTSFFTGLPNDPSRPR